MDRKIDRLARVVKRFIPGSKPLESDQTTFPLKSSDEVFVETYGKADYLDPNALDQEDERAANLIAKLRTAADQPQLVVRSNSEIKRITTIRNNYWANFEAVVELNQQLIVSKEDPTPPTIHEVFTNHLLQTGASILAHRSIEQEAAFVKGRIRGEDHLTPFCEARQFFMIGDTAIRFNGVSIRDIDSKKNLRPHELFGFVMEAILTRRTLGHNNVLAQNTDSEYSRMFPNIAKNQIESGSAKAYALNTLPEEALDNGLNDDSRVTREAAQATRNIMRKLKANIKNAVTAFIDSKSPDHLPMVDTVARYMSGSKLYGFLAVHTMLSGDIGRMAEIFRSSGAHHGSSIHQQVADACYEYARYVPEGLTHIPGEDLDYIFSSEPHLTTTDHNLITQMNNATKLIAQRTSVRAFSTEKDKVEWGAVIPAKELQVDLDKTNPSRVKVTFAYKNDEGESLSIWLSYDTKKERGDWSVLETPHGSPEIKARYIELTRVAVSAVQNAAEQAQELAKDRDAAKAKRLELTPLKPVDKGNVLDQLKEKADSPPQTKPKASRPLTPIQEALEQGFTELTSTDKKIIVIPNPSELEAISRDLPTDDRAYVTAKLKEQNERGVGHIKRLRTPGSDGRPRYSYRVGNARVILQEDESEDNSRRFKIVSIADRKNVYRK